jgi:hypothetical protein
MSLLSKLVGALTVSGQHYNKIQSKQNDFNKSHSELLINQKQIENYNEELEELLKIIESDKYKDIEVKFSVLKETIYDTYKNKREDLGGRTFNEYRIAVMEEFDKKEKQLKTKGIKEMNLEELQTVKKFNDSKINCIDFFEEKRLDFSKKTDELLEFKEILLEKIHLCGKYEGIKHDRKILENRNMMLEFECRTKMGAVNTAKIMRDISNKNR